MKMLFSMDEQVHHFKIAGEMLPPDLVLFRGSMLQFLESNPEFVVLDLSETTLQITDFELQSVLTELKTLASAKAIHIQIAMSDIEARNAKDAVLQEALERQIKVLQGKIELREEMQRNLERIIEANRSLRDAISEKESATRLNKRNPFNPLFEKLWSEK